MKDHVEAVRQQSLEHERDLIPRGQGRDFRSNVEALGFDPVRSGDLIRLNLVRLAYNVL